jgi:hypothetical protein
MVRARARARARARVRGVGGAEVGWKSRAAP